MRLKLESEFGSSWAIAEAHRHVNFQFKLLQVFISEKKFFSFFEKFFSESNKIHRTC